MFGWNLESFLGIWIPRNTHGYASPAYQCWLNSVFPSLGRKCVMALLLQMLREKKKKKAE